MSLKIEVELLKLNNKILVLQQDFENILEIVATLAALHNLKIQKEDDKKGKFVKAQVVTK